MDSDQSSISFVIPTSLLKDLLSLAKAEGATLQEMIVVAVAEKVATA